MKIAILGFADFVKEAPFADPSWTCWGMNGLWRVLPDIPASRFALWFELHTAEFIAAHQVASKLVTQQTDWLAKPHPFPILAQEILLRDGGEKAWPSSERFPVEKLIAHFGVDYFTSTIAFELAYAIYLHDTRPPGFESGVDAIGLWGIDLVHGTEWGEQRPCAEYWLGLAAARGINVVLHPKSALLTQHHRYAYEEANPFVASLEKHLQARAADIDKHLADLRAQSDKIVGELQTYDGARQQLGLVHERLEIYRRGGRI